MKAHRVLLTGATGFVGKGIMETLVIKGYSVVAAVRQSPENVPLAVQVNHIDALDGATNWRSSLEGVDCVIHSAARVHVMNESAEDPLAAFRTVNVEGTLNLARQSVAAGVKRFIFISSIKVNGEATRKGQPFTSDDLPAPADPYGMSKLEAENGLLELAGQTGLEVVIIRSVLVYGPGVKGNFRAMIKWLDKGIPLPLGAIDNRRSLVALGNLTDLVETCVGHPSAANQIFLVSDGDDFSTSGLLRGMARALGRPARLFPIPGALLKCCAALLGKQVVWQRICGSLQVDIGKTRDLLGWTPPISLEAALESTAREYQEKNRK